MGFMDDFFSFCDGPGEVQKVAPFSLSHELALQWEGNPALAGLGVAVVFSSSAMRLPAMAVKEKMATGKKFILRKPSNWRS